MALAPTRDVIGSFIRLLPTRARNGAEMRGKRSICFKKMRVECHLANLLSFKGVKDSFYRVLSTIDLSGVVSK